MHKTKPLGRNEKVGKKKDKSKRFKQQEIRAKAPKCDRASGMAKRPTGSLNQQGREVRRGGRGAETGQSYRLTKKKTAGIAR